MVVNSVNLHKIKGYMDILAKHDSYLAGKCDLLGIEGDMKVFCFEHDELRKDIQDTIRNLVKNLE